MSPLRTRRGRARETSRRTSEHKDDASQSSWGHADTLPSRSQSPSRSQPPPRGQANASDDDLERCIDRMIRQWEFGAGANFSKAERKQMLAIVLSKKVTKKLEEPVEGRNTHVDSHSFLNAGSHLVRLALELSSTKVTEQFFSKAERKQMLAIVLSKKVTEQLEEQVKGRNTHVDSHYFLKSGSDHVRRFLHKTLIKIANYLR